MPRPLRMPPVFPLEKGLVLWLPFNERSGAKAYDRSGKRNDGTLDGASWVAGRRNSVLSFNGVDNKVVIPHAADLSPTKITVAIWLRKNSTTAWAEWIAKRKGTGQRSYNIQTNSSGDYWGSFIWVGGSQLGTYGGTHPDLNTWYYLVMTYDGSAMNLYLNGLRDCNPLSIGGDIDASTCDVWLGRSEEWPNWLDGQISSVRIYNRALTAAEVKRLYESEVMLVRA